MSVDLLPSDVWQYIALKLGAADRIRFGAVSKTWKSLLPCRHPPWLLLADSQEKEGRYEDEPEPEPEDESEDEESDEEEQRDEDEPPPPPPPLLEEEEEDHEHETEPPHPPPPRRGFVCLGEDKIYDFNLPQLYETNCVGSTGSWLITLHRDDTIRLLNPFSKRELFLPGICSFEHMAKTGLFRSPYLQKIVLSSSPSNPSGRGQDCTAMAIHGPKMILAMARLGDSNWTTLQMPALGSHGVLDFIFYKGQFYAITRRGWLLVCDLGDDDDAPKATDICRCDVGTLTLWRMNYLVECLGELLLVVKWIDKFNGVIDYSTHSFQVYKFNFVDGEWNEVQSLGEHSLFLGFNTSVSVPASEYCGLVRKNCIYFTDHFVQGYTEHSKPGRDMGVFDLEDKSIRPHYGGVSTSLYSTPVWIVPSPN